MLGKGAEFDCGAGLDELALALKGATRYRSRMDIPRFHLAFPVRDLAEARDFYGKLLGCPEGRSSDQWIDFDFHGHQIVTHLAPSELGASATNPVDGENVPVRHFGVILTLILWSRRSKSV